MQAELENLRERLACLERDVRRMRRTVHAVSLFVLGGLSGALVLMVGARPPDSSPRTSLRQNMIGRFSIARFTMLDAPGDRRFEVGSWKRGAHALLFQKEGRGPLAGLICTLEWGGAFHIDSPAQYNSVGS